MSSIKEWFRKRRVDKDIRRIADKGLDADEVIEKELGRDRYTYFWNHKAYAGIIHRLTYEDIMNAPPLYEMHCPGCRELAETRKCPKCGTLADKGQPFCRKCGAQIPTQKVSIIKPGQKFCPICNYDARLPEPIRGFVVRSYEKALFYKQGVLIDDVLDDGVYDLIPEEERKIEENARNRAQELEKHGKLDKAWRKEDAKGLLHKIFSPMDVRKLYSALAGTEIIWFNTREYKIHWGVPKRIYTQDKVKIGASGTAYIKITDPKRLVQNFIGGKEKLAPDEFDNWAKEALRGVVTQTLSTYPLEEIFTDREGISTKAKVIGDGTFGDWGVQLARLEIATVAGAEEYEELVIQKAAKAKMISAGTELAMLEKEKELKLAELEAMKAKYEALSATAEDDALAKIEAEKYATMKGIDTEMYLRAKEMGISVEDLVKAEGYRELGKKGVPLDQPTVIMQPGVGVIPVAGTSTKTPTKSVDTAKIKKEIEERQERIEKADDLLLDGKISEEKHSELVTRLRKEIGELKAQLE
jgi:regulator of protease activity HflC (stomatin/prohibitin superfamily)